MNQLGSAGAPVAGSLLTPDPVEETRALERAKAQEAAAEAARHRSDDGNVNAESRRQERQVLAGSDSGRPADPEE
jgi:ubiquinol-cytochrome c reductase cytochrome b subunit